MQTNINLKLNLFFDWWTPKKYCLFSFLTSKLYRICPCIIYVTYKEAHLARSRERNYNSRTWLIHRVSPLRCAAARLRQHPNFTTTISLFMLFEEKVYILRGNRVFTFRYQMLERKQMRLFFCFQTLRRNGIVCEIEWKRMLLRIFPAISFIFEPVPEWKLGCEQKEGDKDTTVGSNIMWEYFVNLWLITD